MSGAVLTVDGLPSSISTPSYVQVTSGSAAGSVSSILTSDATTLTLEDSVAGLSGGDSIRIIAHTTLSDITAASGNTITDASTLTIYNSDGGTSDTYTTYSNLWYDASFGSADSVIVFPGEGIVLNLQGSTELVLLEQLVHTLLMLN